MFTVIPDLNVFKNILFVVLSTPVRLSVNQFLFEGKRLSIINGRVWFSEKDVVLLTVLEEDMLEGSVQC